MTELKNSTTGIFIFRRDLRVNDNLGLIEFCKLCDKVYPVFVLDPRQIRPSKNKYYSHNSFLFMLQSIIELKKTIPKLTVIYGIPEEEIPKHARRLKVSYIAHNDDYTPFSIKRDTNLKKNIKKIHASWIIVAENKEETPPNSITVIQYNDVALNPPKTFKPYQIFTPYYRVASSKRVASVQSFTASFKNKLKKLDNKTVAIGKLATQISKKIHRKTLPLLPKGGRSNALIILRNFKSSNCSKYSSNRDMLTYQTSRIGPYLKFGCVSPREVYAQCNNAVYRKQLYWRDFYLQISHYFPKVYGNNFRHNIKWKNNRSLFDKWCKGKTGFPVVDAAMVQLNTSGWMHNRARMIVASFLTKLLHIDWRWGERYFAQKLVDYDPSNNNGGWQWSAGTGTDAQPYYRIFNPITQQKKFDPNNEYVKKWLGKPYVFNEKAGIAINVDSGAEYIRPIINYVAERTLALKLYQK